MAFIATDIVKNLIYRLNKQGGDGVEWYVISYTK